MTANYTYQPGSPLVDTITYGNGMTAAYLFDGSARVQQIRYVSNATTRLQLDYTYTADDLPATITESGSMGSATVTYTYDKRRRLTREVRTGSNPLDITYVYDKGGNRTQKIESHLNRRTDYFYDLPTVQHGVTINPADFKSSNNRLEYYKVYNTTGGGNVLLSTTWYYY
jgi:YD repeat-containing protein